MGKVTANREDQVATELEFNGDLIAQVIAKILDDSPRKKKYHQLLKKSFTMVVYEDIYEARLQRTKLLNKILTEYLYGKAKK